jgi:hypothetical protein
MDEINRNDVKIARYLIVDEYPIHKAELGQEFVEA